MPSQLRRHDELGQIHFTTFSCFRRLQFFRHEIVRDAFIGAMKQTRERLGIRWIGYVIMPEHVHLLVFPERTEADDGRHGRECPTPPGRATEGLVPISTVLHDLKGLSGRDCKQALREVWRQHRSLGTRPLDAWATGTGAKPFWKPRGHDFNVIHESKVREKLEYMHANPLRRGLVDRPEDWRWSSCGFYELGDDSLIAMDWRGQFPIL